MKMILPTLSKFFIARSLLCGLVSMYLPLCSADPFSRYLNTTHRDSYDKLDADQKRMVRDRVKLKARAETDYIANLDFSMSYDEKRQLAAKAKYRWERLCENVDPDGTAIWEELPLLEDSFNGAAGSAINDVLTRTRPSTYSYVEDEDVNRYKSHMSK